MDLGMLDDGFQMKKFDGTEKLLFHQYQKQLLAIGGVKGFDDALTTSLPTHTALGLVIDNNVKARKLAWSYLYLTTNGAAQALIENQSSNDPSVAWTALKNRYEPSTVEAYTQITREMETCELDDPEEDPKAWMQNLSRFNSRLALIGGRSVSYSKNDLQMVDFILNKLPKSNYEPFITAFGITGSSQITLGDFQSKVRHYWRNSIKGKKDSSTEISMSLSNDKA